MDGSAGEFYVILHHNIPPHTHIRAFTATNIIKKCVLIIAQNPLPSAGVIAIFRNMADILDIVSMAEIC